VSIDTDVHGVVHVSALAPDGQSGNFTAFTSAGPLAVGGFAAPNRGS